MTRVAHCLFASYLLALTVAVIARAQPPAGWMAQALCIHRHESTDWHKRTDWLGRVSRDHGGMQIDVSTWAAYAPRGYPADPADASPRAQLAVAYRIWLANGRRWGGQWPWSSRECGLK